MSKKISTKVKKNIKSLETIKTMETMDSIDTDINKDISEEEESKINEKQPLQYAKPQLTKSKILTNTSMKHADLKKLCFDNNLLDSLEIKITKSEMLSLISGYNDNLERIEKNLAK